MHSRSTGTRVAEITNSMKPPPGNNDNRSMRSERLVWTEPRRRRESPVEPWLPLRTVPRYLSAVTPQARPAAVSRYSRGTPAAAAIPHGVALHSMSQPPLHSPRAADPLASCRNLWSQVDQEDHLGPVGSAQASEVTSAVGGTGKYSALATLEARCLLVARDGTGKMLSSGGTPWRMSMTGPGHAHVVLTDHNDGTHSAIYTCSTSGTYSLHVRIGQRRVYDGRVLVFDAHDAPEAAIVRQAFGFQTSLQHSPQSLLSKWVIWSSLRTLSLAVRMELKAAAQGFHRQWCTRDAILEMAKYSVLRKTAVVAKASQQRAVAMRHWRRRSGLDEPGNGRLDTRREWDDEWLHHAATRGGLKIALRRWLRVLTSDWAMFERRGPGAIVVYWLKAEALMTRALRWWAGFKELEKRKRAMAIQMSVLLQWSQSSCRRAQNSWRDFTTARKQHLLCVERVVGHWRGKEVRAAFHTWLQRRSEHISMLDCIGQVLKRWQQLQKNHAIRRWLCSCQAQLDNSYSQAWLHWGYRGTLNAMSRWKRHAAWRIRMMILVTLWHQNERGRGWRSWRQYARARSCKLKLATTSLKKWRQWQLASSWRAWRDEACAVAFRVRFCLRLGFRQWVSHSAVVSATLEAASAVWIRWASGQVARAFATWFDSASVRASAMAVARNVVLRLMHQELSKAVWQWRRKLLQRATMTSAADHYRHAALKRAFRYWLDVLTLMTNVRRLMGRWALRELRLATDRWCEHTAARLDILKLAAVTLKQWRQWQLASSWRAWRHEVCSVSFNLRFCLRLGFRQWVSHSAVVSAALRAASAVWSKWASGQVARAFATWFDSASVRASAMAVARNVVLRLMHQELSKAVWQWRRKLLQRATMTSAADHYRSIALKKIRWAAFRWSATCAFIRRMRRPLLLFTQFRGIHLLGRAWRKWVKVFFDQSKVNIVTSVVIRKWRYWQQSAAWCSWLAAAQSRAGAISLVKGSVAKWAHYTSTGRAFRRWLELTRARVAALVSTRAALVSWLNSQCMHALRSWKDYTVAAAKALAIVTSAVQIWIMNGLSHACRLWMHQTRTSQTFLRTVRNLRLVRYHARWRALSKSRSARLCYFEATTVAAINRWYRAELTSAFSKWVHVSKLELRARRVLHCWTRLALSRGFRGWIDHVALQVEFLGIVSAVIWRWQSCSLAILWRFWRFWALACTFDNFCTQKRRFWKWADQTSTSRGVMRAMSTAWAKRQQRQIALSYRAWTKHALLRSSLRAKFIVAMQRFYQSPLHRTFHRWLQSAKQKFKASRLDAAVLLRSLSAGNTSGLDAGVSLRQLGSSLCYAFAKWTVISTHKASFRTTIHTLSLSRLERSYRSWLLFAAAVHEYAELSGFSQKRAHYGMLKSALRKWNRLVRKQSVFWKPHDAFIYNKLTYLRMQRALARWRSYLWLVVKYRSEMQRKAIVEHVQDSMARIREHAVTREEHVAELLRDNANLRSNAATMQDTLNRCDKQLSQLAGKRDPAVAVSWYVDFLEERVEEMRCQLTDVVACSLRSLPSSPENNEPLPPGAHRGLFTSLGADKADSRFHRHPSTKSSVAAPVSTTTDSIHPSSSAAASGRRLLRSEPHRHRRHAQRSSQALSQEKRFTPQCPAATQWPVASQSPAASHSPAALTTADSLWPSASLWPAVHLTFAEQSPLEGSQSQEAASSSQARTMPSSNIVSLPSPTIMEESRSTGKVSYSQGRPDTANAIGDIVSDFDTWRELALEEAKMWEIAREWQVHDPMTG